MSSFFGALLVAGKTFTTFAAETSGTADGTTTGTGMGIWMIVIYMVVIIGFFYLIAVRPQKKQTQQHDEMMKNLKPGDSIMTTSGFYGTVIGIDDDTVIVEFGSNKNCRIPMHMKAIAEVESRDAVYEEASEDSGSEEKESKLGKKKKS